MSVEDNKRVVLKGWECVSNNDLKGVVATLYHQDAVYHGSAGEEAKGPAAIAESLSPYFSAFSGMKATVEDIFGEGDRVFSRVRLEGTNSGELMGMPATGKRVDIRWIMNVARFQDGKVIEEWEIFDTMDMMQQLGHVPAQG